MHSNDCRVAWVLLLIVLPGCGSGEHALDSGGTSEVPADFTDLEFSSPPVVQHDDAGRVQVELTSVWDDDGRLVVRAEFTPDDSGFHLYDSKLPMAGVMGVGRPTLIEVTDVNKYAKVGPVIADKTPLAHFDKTLGATLSVYPDGPVTLYLPIQFQAMPVGPSKLTVQLTYMSCSDARCNVPVERAVAEISVAAPTTAP